MKEEAELVGVCLAAEEEIERGGVGRAEVEAVGVEREAEGFAAGVPWRTAMVETEEGTMRGCEEGGEVPGGREEGGGPARGWY